MPGTKGIASATWFVAGTAALVSACTTMHRRYELAVGEEAARQPRTADIVIREADLQLLPAPVATWLRRAGVVGRPRVHDFTVEMDAELWRDASGSPMRTRITQHSFVDRPARFFFMRTSMLGLPVRGLHAYAGTDASMRVRVAGLLTVVDERGPGLHRAETVTVLNDLCLMAPAALLDARISWTPVDDRSARVTFTNGSVQVSALLTFDDQGDLADFASDDRHYLASDGDRWTTPIRSYRDAGAMHLPSAAEAVWHYRDKASFRYGRFRILRVHYNVAHDRQAGSRVAP